MRHSGIRRLLPLALLVIFLALLSGEVLACPNCKEALANQGGDTARLQDGFGYSILFMLAMPFLLLGAGTLAIVRAVRRGALPEF